MKGYSQIVIVVQTRPFEKLYVIDGDCSIDLEVVNFLLSI